MQNLPNAAGRQAPGPLPLPFAALAQPKVVLMAAGLLGLALDLFVRPLSWVGLALIALATAPWMLQAWSQRSASVAGSGREPRSAKEAAVAAPAGRARSDQGIVAGGERTAGARPEQPSPSPREIPRAAPIPEPVPRQPSARPPEGERRAAPPRSPDGRPAPQRLPDAPSAVRRVRPETAG